MAAQDWPLDAQGRQHRLQLVHSVRLRNIRAAVWANEGDQGPRYNTTFCRLYKDGEGNWQSTGSFGRDDLLRHALAEHGDDGR